MSLKVKLAALLILASFGLGLPIAGAVAKSAGTDPASHRSSNASAKPKRVPSVRMIRVPREAGLTIGFSLASELSSGTPASVTASDSRAHTEGAQLVRLDVNWASVAPTQPANGSNPDDPAYNWAATDQAVKDLGHDGFTVMITVQDAPAWAEGSGKPTAAAEGSWEPNVSAFAQFGTAIATRYNGGFADPAAPGTDLPRVSDWQPWNEPNLPLYLSPSWVKSGSGWTDAAAAHYRDMLDAFYTSVKAVSANNFVVAAGTAPYGDPAGDLARIPPVTFDQDLFCLTAQNQPAGNCSNPAEFDAIDHHPYVSGQANESPTWHAELPNDVSIPDIYKLTAVLHAAEQAGTVLPTGSKQIWVTELAWESSPPQSSSLGVPVAREALWAEQALYVLWSQGVDTALWYQLDDPALNPDGSLAIFTDGLYFANGTAKPAAQSFRFPFLTNRRTKNAVQAWGRSPASGTLTIQRKAGNRWISILKLKVSAGEVFEAPISQRGSATFRATVNGIYSIGWPQSA